MPSSAWKKTTIVQPSRRHAVRYTLTFSCITVARVRSSRSFFFFNDTATTEIYTLSLHDALPIFRGAGHRYVERDLGLVPSDRRGCLGGDGREFRSVAACEILAPAQIGRAHV